MSRKKILVLAAPSGAGKTTMKRFVMRKFPRFGFSISATTRLPRPKERQGVDYHFIGVEEFKSGIEKGEFVEYEEIFGNYYGTIKSDVDAALAEGKLLIFDVDFKGAFSIQKAYPEESLLVFIAPPSLDALEERLRSRASESDEQIATRLSRAEMEIAASDKFDKIIVNDNLNKAKTEIYKLVENAFFS